MAVIEFINGKNRTYSGMKRAINYILREDKTKLGLYSGYNCDPENAYGNFVLTKRIFNKEKGRQYIHFIQSFSDREKVDEEMVKKVADELLLMDKFKGFQVVYAVHTDTDNLHTHFILNAVNSETGEKWRLSKEELLEIKDYSDELCRKYELTVTHGKKGAHINRGEYRTKSQGKSWKYETYLAIKYAKNHAVSKADFINKLNKLNYQVNWSDSRKYITFTNSEGRKVRNRKLYPPEHFTKEALENRFELNVKNLKKRKLDSSFEGLLGAMKLFEINQPSQSGTNSFPLTQLEGKAKNDMIAEIKKGEGLNWEKEKNNNLEI